MENCMGISVCKSTSAQQVCSYSEGINQISLLAFFEEKMICIKLDINPSASPTIDSTSAPYKAF